MSHSTRSRIVEPSPPAPVVAPRVVPSPPEPVEDKSALTGANSTPENESNESVIRSTGSMAIATLISRITGFLRTVLISATLGGAITSAFNTANQLPNLITEIVLGAVLTSLVVPVLVRAEREDPDNGAMFVRRLFTLAFTLLAIITVSSVIAAPLLTRMMLTSDGEVNTTLSTSFAILLLPQIFFYGLFALFQAVLNTKSIFKPAAWAPVVNNVISIATLLLYWTLPGSLNPVAPAPVTDRHVLLLGVGTTLGVVLQFAILLPFIKKAGIDLRPKWGLDDRLKQFGGMALAIVAYVAISQLGYIITTRVAASSSADAPGIYQQAWQLLQMPYGIIGVALLTAIMPRLSRNAAAGDDRAVIHDLQLATKLTLIALIPIVIFMTGFGQDLGIGLFQYAEYDREVASVLGYTVSFSAFTLIPYALVLLHLRVFYAREEAWTPTFIVAGITATKILLSLLSPFIASSNEAVVTLLGAANGFSFISGAVIGGFLLRRKLGNVGGRQVMHTSLWATAAAIVGVAVALVVRFLIDLLVPEPQPSLLILIQVIVCGVVFVIVTGIVLSFSKLPEVQNLGRAMARIPGVGRFIHPNEDSAIQVEEPDAREVSAQMMAQDTFNASPVPPPMSAGVVRGPRLVPGAPVSDGRFRLLREHGSVPGAQFWQAREQSTGREVGLTFVTTTSQAPMAPATPAVAARRSAEISRRTRKLGQLGLSSVADNIEILSYRSGCLVVADWVEGTSLRQVGESDNLDPHAVAHALQPLVEDTHAAHENDLTMGLDNADRIRISTAGKAVLAFPAVFTDADEESDREAVGSAITLLVTSTSPTPTMLRDIAESDAPLPEIAEQLREFAPDDEALAVEEEAEIEVEEQTSGFGNRGYSGSGVAAIGATVILFVVLVAAITAWLISMFGSQSEQKPITPESIQGSQEQVAEVPPVMLQRSDARVLPSGAAATDVIDDEPATMQEIDSSNNEIAVRVENPTQLRHVLITSNVGGAKVEILGLKGSTPGETLGEATLHKAANNITLEESAKVYDGVVVRFTDLPSKRDVMISEIELTGLPR